MKDNFDVHEWNKKRYLGEGFNDRVLKARLTDINYDILTNYFNDERFHAPNPDDSSRQINGKDDWIDWKQRTLDGYGNVDIELDNTKVWYDQFKVLNNKFTGDKEGYSRGKQATLDRWRQTSNSGLD